ncbi:hypothetical protein [Streptomyces sp. NPDC058247]|uniref:hypothetical protein n=1 Tax=Streptomyces sp. NPDC058247 TaxID=3346401 RepID=UPI0036E03BD6
MPDIAERRQRFWVRTGIVLFFCLPILLTLHTSPALLVTILNLLYYVGVQLVPGTMAIFFMRGIRAVGVSAGLIVGTVLALMLYYGHVDTLGIDVGLISGLLNFAVMVRGEQDRAPRPHPAARDGVAPIASGTAEARARRRTQLITEASASRSTSRTGRGAVTSRGSPWRRGR